MSTGLAHATLSTPTGTAQVLLDADASRDALRKIASRAGLLRRFNSSSAFRRELESRRQRYARSLDAQLDEAIRRFLPRGIRGIFHYRAFPPEAEAETASAPAAALAKEVLLDAAERVLTADLGHLGLRVPREDESLCNEVVEELHAMGVIPARDLTPTTVEVRFDPDTGRCTNGPSGSVGRLRAHKISTRGWPDLLLLRRRKTLLSSFGKLVSVDPEMCPSPCFDDVGIRIVAPDNAWTDVANHVATRVGVGRNTPSAETSGSPWRAKHFYVRLAPSGVPVEIQVMPLSNWLDANTTAPNSTFLYSQRVFLKRILPRFRPPPTWNVAGLWQSNGVLSDELLEFARRSVVAALESSSSGVRRTPPSAELEQMR